MENTQENNLFSASNSDMLINLGFVEFEGEDKKDIINYARLMDRQRELRDEILGLVKTGVQLKGISDFEKSILMEIDKKIDDFFNTWMSFVDFFKNPPKQEEFEKINHALILQKALLDFKSFSNNLESLNLSEQSKEFSTQFTNFTSSTQAKLENIVAQYDDFLLNFIHKQKEHVEPFEKQLNTIVKTYDNSFAKMLKVAKGSIFTLLIANALLVFVFGVLGGIIYFQKLELESIIHQSQYLENIKVTHNKNSILFEFDAGKAKIIEESGVKKVILNTK